jgi:hypothetical protein
MCNVNAGYNMDFQLPQMHVGTAQLKCYGLEACMSQDFLLLGFPFELHSHGTIYLCQSGMKKKHIATRTRLLC